MATVDMVSSSTSASFPSMTDTIKDWDVVFGRGGKSNTHIGNRRFRGLIVQAQPEYLAARKKDKTYIAQRIVKTMQANGGRFLKRATSGVGKVQWFEVEVSRAIAKTSQGLREGLDVRNHKLRPSKIFKHIESDTNSVKRSSIPGTIATREAAARVSISPDPTPGNSPAGPRPLIVPSQIFSIGLGDLDWPLLLPYDHDDCTEFLGPDTGLGMFLDETMPTSPLDLIDCDDLSTVFDIET